MGMTGGYVAKYSCDCCNKAVEISNDYFEKNDAAWSDYIQTANLAGQALERQMRWSLLENGDVLCNECTASEKRLTTDQKIHILSWKEFEDMDRIVWQSEMMIRDLLPFED